MNRQRILAFVFLAVALVQLAVPAQRIWLYEQTLRQGNVFKFKTAPVDPYDAFRGRYVALRFDAGSAVWHGKEQLPYGTDVFVTVETGADGFAKLGEASLKRPASGDYLQVVANYGTNEGQLRVEFPFDRFYMEESIAPEAERVYREHSRKGDARDAFAMVRIREGLGVIEQVFVGEKTLGEAAKAALAEPAK